MFGIVAMILCLVQMSHSAYVYIDENGNSQIAGADWGVTAPDAGCDCQCASYYHFNDYGVTDGNCKTRNKYPHGYGRKKRSAAPLPYPQWTLLDPNTGRPVDHAIEVPAVLRRERQPLDEGQQVEQDIISRHLENGEVKTSEWDYSFYKKHPYTG